MLNPVFEIFGCVRNFSSQIVAACNAGERRAYPRARAFDAADLVAIIAAVSANRRASCQCIAAASHHLDRTQLAGTELSASQLHAREAERCGQKQCEGDGLSSH